MCGNLLGQGLLQRSQRRVGVGRVRLQGLDSVFQAAQLLVFVPQLVLQVLDLHGRAALRAIRPSERRVHKGGATTASAWAWE